MSTVQAQSCLALIRSRGYWKVVIRPTVFNQNKIAFPDLFDLVREKAVRLRGQPYPFVGTYAAAHPTREGQDWIEFEGRFHEYLEFWRFYQSGQFVHFFGIPSDWRQESQWGDEMDYIDTLYTFTEIFEFAARLALSEAGTPMMHLEIDIVGLRNRKLSDAGTGRVFRSTDLYECRAEKWEWRRTEAQTKLIAEPRALAVQAARDLFSRFDLRVSVEVLRSLQERIGR
ncbi:MAG: hypothetical protein P4L84_12740 [Isosphaeraceae bacterium]|nr:hypothetical protein [Isosphaeraceae bacterium]